MPQHDNGMEYPAPKGGWLNRKLRTQLAVLIILLECAVVLALVSHVITVPVPPEPMWTMTIGGTPAPAPSDVRQKPMEKQRVADAAAHAAKNEPFNPFAGIVEGVACGLPVEEPPHDNADDASRPDGNVLIGADAAGTVPLIMNDGTDAASQPRHLNHENVIIGSDSYIGEDWRVNLTIPSVCYVDPMLRACRAYRSMIAQPKQNLDEDEEPDDGQEQPVLIMQGTLDCLPDERGESGINVITGDEDL